MRNSLSFTLGLKPTFFTNPAPVVRWRGSTTGSWERERWRCDQQVLGSNITRAKLRNNLGKASCSYICASVTKQYNLVPARGRWCSAGGKVTAGLAKIDGSILPGGWLIVTCGLTACTPGSAPGPTLGNEYGKPLPSFCYPRSFTSSPGLPLRAITPTVSSELLGLCFYFFCFPFLVPCARLTALSSVF